MNDTTLLKTRIRKVGDKAEYANGSSVLYLMSRDQRVSDNYALIAAQQHALARRVPLVVLYVVFDARSGRRAREQARFLIDGLRDVKQQLGQNGIGFVVRSGRVVPVTTAVARQLQPLAVYTDFNPLRGPRAVQDKLSGLLDCPLYIVDAHNLVPVWVASQKLEVGARTLRPKITHYLPNYIADNTALVHHPHPSPAIEGISLEEAERVIDKIYPANGTDISRYRPGETAAQAALADFIARRLPGYAERRNDPSQPNLSELSPYLHYGQLASIRVARAAYEALKQNPSLGADVAALIEEMIVRKELSDNWCYYNPEYDRLAGAPAWAQATLAKHCDDPREFVYSRTQFERAETHDEAWNAAQRQLVRTGKMHGYMRMYWAKKVLEWSASPQQALEILFYLNDFYSIDGGDPNGYVGIMWSVAGVHDRPWGERAVYGTIRSMVYNGLKRKFDIQSYIKNYQ